MAETTLDIQVDDSQAESLINTLRELADAMSNLKSQSNSTASAVDNVGDESAQAANKVDDLDNASSSSGSSLSGLGAAAGRAGLSIGKLTGAVAVGVVAIAGLDSIGTALQTTFDFAKDSIEGLSESGRAMSKDLVAVSASFRGARLNLAELILSAIGGEQAISDLNFVAVELAESFAEVSEEMGGTQSVIIPLTTAMISMGLSAASTVELFTKLATSLQFTGEVALVTADLLAAAFSADAELATRAVNRLDRRLLELANTNDNVSETVAILRSALRDLKSDLEVGSGQTLTYANSVRTLREQFGLLGELLTGGVELSGGDGGGVGRMVENIDRAIRSLLNPIQFAAFDIAQSFWDGVTDGIKDPTLQAQADNALQEWGDSMWGNINLAEQALIAFAEGVDTEDLIEEFGKALQLSEAAEELLRADRDVFPDIVRRNVIDPTFEAIREGGEDILNEHIRWGNQLANQSRKLDNFSLFPYVDEAPAVIQQIEDLSDQITDLNAHYDLLASIAPEEMLPRIEEARNSAITYITDQIEELLGYYDQLKEPLTISDAADVARMERIAEAAGKTKDELQAAIKTPTIEPAQAPDFSGFENQVLSGLMRDLDDQDRAITTVAEAWDSITMAQQRYAKNAGMSIKDVNDALNEQREAVREAFRTEAVDAFSDTLGGFAEYAGQALAGVVDKQLSAGEKAKKLIGSFFGDFLKTIGTTAIAQGAIISIADPASGGFPNPGKGAALIAAGIAATVAGAAISGKAGAVGGKQKKDTPDTGGGVPSSASAAGPSTTNVFISNQFGNRFDARELDRSAAATFAAAAAQGQI